MNNRDRNPENKETENQLNIVPTSYPGVMNTPFGMVVKGTGDDDDGRSYWNTD